MRLPREEFAACIWMKEQINWSSCEIHVNLEKRYNQSEHYFRSLPWKCWNLKCFLYIYYIKLIFIWIFQTFSLANVWTSNAMIFFYCLPFISTVAASGFGGLLPFPRIYFNIWEEVEADYAWKVNERIQAKLQLLNWKGCFLLILITPLVSRFKQSCM